MAKSSKKSQEAIENGNMNPEAENMNNEAMEQEAQEQEAQEQEAQEQEAQEQEAQGQAAPEQENETPEQKSARLIREERLKEAKTYIGHKAMYVPAEDYEFHPATVVGAVVDSKGTVLVALRTEDGKRVTKKFGSKLLRVLDEMAERPVRSRTKTERQLVTDEAIAAHREKIGLPVTLDELEGRVRGVQVDRRTSQIYLTIHLADGSKRHSKMNNENLHFGEADNETGTIRTAYFALLDQRAQGSKSSPERQVQAFGAGFIKAYKALVEAGKMEETENLVACVEAVMEEAKALNQTAASAATAATEETAEEAAE